MKYISFFLLTLFFSNCESTKKTPENTTNTNFEIIAQSDYGGKETKTYEVIKSQSELDKALEGIYLEEAITNKIKAVDFSTQMVLSLHAGLHNTGGYSIGVENVEIKGSTTYVMIKTISPNPDEPVTMALTNPFCIALIDTNENVVFK